MAGKVTITSGLLLGRTEVLRSLRHYLRAQSLERTREGHRESDEHWNRFKGDVAETSERRGGAHMDFSESMDTILN